MVKIRKNDNKDQNMTIKIYIYIYWQPFFGRNPSQELSGKKGRDHRQIFSEVAKIHWESKDLTNIKQP